MLFRYVVTAGGRAVAVEVELADDGSGRVARVLVDGQARALDVRAVAPGVWSWLEGTQSASVRLDGKAPRVVATVACAGQVAEVPIEVADARAITNAADTGGARRDARAAGPVVVRAPMPGRVVKVVVKPGDKVAAGQGVVVVEAMKMENELKAPRAGVVEAVRVTEGTAVERDAELIVIGG